MTKIKICGLKRQEDIQYVNEALPDYAGFVIQVSFSRRSITAEELYKLRSRLSEKISPVGVFVNAPVELPAKLLREGILDMAQLHGQEDDEYIKRLKEETGRPVMKAFSVSAPEDIQRAFSSSADLILLDHGRGGTGKSFDWDLVKGEKNGGRPYFLAGGITPEKIPQAVRRLKPYGIDLSSAVETEGKKDRRKILAAVAAVRSGIL